MKISLMPFKDKAPLLNQESELKHRAKGFLYLGKCANMAPKLNRVLNAPTFSTQKHFPPQWHQAMESYVLSTIHLWVHGTHQPYERKVEWSQGLDCNHPAENYGCSKSLVLKKSEKSLTWHLSSALALGEAGVSLWDSFLLARREMNTDLAMGARHCHCPWMAHFFFFFVISTGRVFFFIKPASSLALFSFWMSPCGGFSTEPRVFLRRPQSAVWRCVPKWVTGWVPLPINNMPHKRSTHDSVRNLGGSKVYLGERELAWDA